MKNAPGIITRRDMLRGSAPTLTGYNRAVRA